MEDGWLRGRDCSMLEDGGQAERIKKKADLDWEMGLVL
jgi:hypothetical protein